MEKDVTDQEYERVKSHIEDYSFIDLVIWRNELITARLVNNRIFHLIDNEILKRNSKLYEENLRKKIL